MGGYSTDQSTSSTRWKGTATGRAECPSSITTTCTQHEPTGTSGMAKPVFSSSPTAPPRAPGSAVPRARLVGGNRPSSRARAPGGLRRPCACSNRRRRQPVPAGGSPGWAGPAAPPEEPRELWLRTLAPPRSTTCGTATASWLPCAARSKPQLPPGRLRPRALRDRRQGLGADPEALQLGPALGPLRRRGHWRDLPGPGRPSPIPERRRRMERPAGRPATPGTCTGTPPATASRRARSMPSPVPPSRAFGSGPSAVK